MSGDRSNSVDESDSGLKMFRHSLTQSNSNPRPRGLCFLTFKSKRLQVTKVFCRHVPFLHYSSLHCVRLLSKGSLTGLRGLFKQINAASSVCGLGDCSWTLWTLYLLDTTSQGVRPGQNKKMYNTENEKILLNMCSIYIVKMKRK